MEENWPFILHKDNGPKTTRKKVPRKERKGTPQAASAAMG